MPSIAKQRHGKRAKVIVKRSQRYLAKSKSKPFNPLCGKLKRNNNLLAKALSLQKQENQLLFTEKVELTSQLQALTLACNKRDVMLASIENNAKEMLSMLVTMTNHVTNTIVCCQKVSHRPEAISQINAASATRRESTRRLSTKSPARGVVKPMVSGHTITKPTISLRRLNVQRINDLADLSVIEEGSPARLNSSVVNTNQIHTAAFTNASRLGYEGERRRRLPERIPLEYIEADDDERDSPSKQERRKSGRSSGRRSSSCSKRNSGSIRRNSKEIASQIRSPSVSLCDVSRLLQNSQSINIRTLENSRGSENFINRSNTAKHFSPRISGQDKRSFDMTIQRTQSSHKYHNETLPSLNDKTSNVTVNSSNIQPEVEDPIEGPSWLLNSLQVDSPYRHNSDLMNDSSVKRRKKNMRIIDSSDSDGTVEDNVRDDSMEFTECVNTQKRLIENPTSNFINVQSNNIAECVVQGETNENASQFSNSDDTSTNSNNKDVCSVNIAINRFNDFVTDRRQCFNLDDDDDETIVLRISKPAETAKFDITQFRLPVLNSPIIAPAEPDDSESEVTTTIQRIPQNYAGSKLLLNNIDDRVSNYCSLQLPKIDDDPKTIKIKQPDKQKTPKKNVKFLDMDSSESDDSDYGAQTRKKFAELVTSKIAKDPSTATVVLEKLVDTNVKIRSRAPIPTTVIKPHDLNDISTHRKSEDSSFEQSNASSSTTHSMSETSRPRRQKAPINLKEANLLNEKLKQRKLEDISFEHVNNSGSSTHSMSETSRPRRQKAPTNLKEPSLQKKLRRNK